MDLSSPTPRLSSEQRDEAISIFNAVIEAHEPLQPKNGPYRQITLVRLTYEYARSETSKDNFLHFFFKHTQIPSEASEWEKIRECDHGPQLTAFADILIENFFLPLKASSGKTPKPSPLALSDLQSVHTPAGTTQRVAKLRQDCFIRDHHRCVISRIFDLEEATKRANRHGEEHAQDDMNNYLKDEIVMPESLEVAHIIPHSLMAIKSGKTELDESKKTALAILNMFDDGVVHLLGGTDIDRPGNAITLTLDLHQRFGNFAVYFTPHGTQPHTYRIDSIRSSFLRPRFLPVDRTLLLIESRTIDPPSPRLLAIHNAITHILHCSAAGDYIDKILEDLDRPDIKADGSSELGHIINLRIQGWWNGQIRAY